MKPGFFLQAGRIRAAVFTTVTAGTPDVFESDTTHDPQIAMISETKGVVVYRDTNNSNRGTMVVLTITGTSISAGTPVVFNTAATTQLYIDKLTSTQAIVSYRDGTTALKTFVCTVSGTTPSAGTIYTIDGPDVCSLGSVTALTETLVLYTYRNATETNGKSIAATVSGSTLSLGTPFEFSASATQQSFVHRISDTKGIVVFRDEGDGNFCKTRMLSVSGTTVSAGTVETIKSSSALSVHVQGISATKAVCYFGDITNVISQVCILTISGTDITVEALTTVSDATSAGKIALLDGTQAVVSYTDEDNLGYGTARIIAIGATTITAEDPVVFESADILSVGTFTITGSTVIVTYVDSGNSSFGTAIVLEAS